MKKLLVFLLVLGLPSLTFAFTSECTGGTITYSGGRVIHSFTSNGTLNCNGTGGGFVEALVVGGGGGGGAGQGGGGGGGGYQYDSNFSVSGTSISVTVGVGGSGGTAPSNNGTAGSSGGIQFLVV